MKFKEIEKFDEVHHLGFSEREVYEIELTSQNSDEILLEVLKSDIFFDAHNYQDYRNEKVRNYLTRENHAFTDKVELQDFEKLTYSQLEKRISEIEKEDDWGEDLPIFKKWINNSMAWIRLNNYQNEQFYFIYAESIPKDKLIEYNYYSYFMSIIIISISESKVVIINHGED